MEPETNLNEDPIVEETISPQPGGTSWLPIAIGVAAIFVGGIALYLSIHGSNRFTETDTALSNSQEQIDALKTEIESLHSVIEILEQKNQTQEKQIRSVTSQAQSAINKIGKEIASTQRQVSSNLGTLGELASALEELKIPEPAPVATPKPPKTEVASTSPQETNSGSSPKTHIIESGDTFGALAKSYGIPLNELIAANPDANPRSLRIGQKVNIP